MLYNSYKVVIYMVESFEKITQTDEIFFKYAKGKSYMIGKEFHTYNEILLFIDGNSEFIYEKGKEKLSPYTIVIIPKETFHQFIISGNENNYTRCVFNFKNVSQLDKIIDDKLKEITIIQNERINEIFRKLMTLEYMHLNETETNILLKALLAQILVELKTENTNTSKKVLPFNSKVDIALEYINQNLQNNLNLTVIANALNISESYLSHIFKNDMHISIHKYILKKRLLLAHKKIEDSIPPVQAAYESGFNDYSGFYTQFKKMFGVSPSKLNSN